MLERGQERRRYADTINLEHGAGHGPDHLGRLLLWSCTTGRRYSVSSGPATTGASDFSSASTASGDMRGIDARNAHWSS